MLDDIHGRGPGPTHPSDRNHLLPPRARTVDPHAYGGQDRPSRGRSVLVVALGVATGASVAAVVPEHGVLLACVAAGAVVAAVVTGLAVDRVGRTGR